MKRSFLCIFLCCFIFSLFSGCSRGENLDLKEFDASWDTDLLGKTVTVPLSGKDAGNNRFMFSFHPDWDRLFLFYLPEKEPFDEVVAQEGFVLELDVEYDSCEELVESSAWSGVLLRVYPNNSVMHNNAHNSIPFQYDQDGRSNVRPEEARGPCYGTYSPDPERPGEYIPDGVYNAETLQSVGLLIAISPGQIPWGFQDYYDTLS